MSWLRGVNGTALRRAPKRHLLDELEEHLLLPLLPCLPACNSPPAPSVLHMTISPRGTHSAPPRDPTHRFQTSTVARRGSAQGGLLRLPLLPAHESVLIALSTSCTSHGLEWVRWGDGRGQEACSLPLSSISVRCLLWHSGKAETRCRGGAAFRPGPRGRVAAGRIAMTPVQ